MLSDYEVIDAIGGDESFDLFRGRRMHSDAPVLLRLPQPSIARADAYAMLRAEFSIATKLASAGYHETNLGAARQSNRGPQRDGPRHRDVLPIADSPA